MGVVGVKVYWRLLFECVCADWSKISDRTGSFFRGYASMRWWLWCHLCYDVIMHSWQCMWLSGTSSSFRPQP